MTCPLRFGDTWHRTDSGKRHSPHRREEFIDALKKSGWNKAKAAKTLGISRQTIYRKMRELLISEPDDHM